jgi:hypothetical protein
MKNFFLPPRCATGSTNGVYLSALFPLVPWLACEDTGGGTTRGQELSCKNAATPLLGTWSEWSYQAQEDHYTLLGYKCI